MGVFHPRDDAEAIGVCAKAGCGFTKGGIIVVPDDCKMDDKRNRLTRAVLFLCDEHDYDWTWARDNRNTGHWWIAPLPGNPERR